MPVLPLKNADHPDQRDKKKVQVFDPEPAGKFETTHSQPAEPRES